MLKLRPLRCSFCKKRESEVSKLVAGPRVFICDGCVAIASRIMDGGSPSPAPPSHTPAWLKLWDRCRGLLHLRFAPSTS